MRGVIFAKIKMKKRKKSSSRCVYFSLQQQIDRHILSHINIMYRYMQKPNNHGLLQLTTVRYMQLRSRMLYQLSKYVGTYTFVPRSFYTIVIKSGETERIAQSSRKGDHRWSHRVNLSYANVRCTTNQHIHRKYNMAQVCKL